MRATVTGGAGFIGSNIVCSLLEGGADVVVLDDFSTGHETNLPEHPNLEIIEGDIRDSEVVARAVAGCETVFHLAASVGNRRALQDPVVDSEINVIGSLKVLMAAAAAGVRNVVASSSAAIYGEAAMQPVGEKAPMAPATPYAASKLAMESQGRAFSILQKLDVVCLRYFNVYGEHQRFDRYGNVIPIFARRLLRNEPLVIYGDGQQTRDFVHVSDVVAANLAAAGARGLCGAYNIASGTGATINSLVTELGTAAGRPVAVQHAGPRVGDVRHSRADIRAATRDLGYRPQVALRDGLVRYLAWLEGTPDGPAAVPQPAASEARLHV